MDKSDKKARVKQWREQERAGARAEFPLPVADLRRMFDMLDQALGQHPCDHSRRLTEAWLAAQGLDPVPVLEWLAKHGGYCDCEILGNVEQHVDESS